jgi:hypothetical protein
MKLFNPFRIGGAGYTVIAISFLYVLFAYFAIAMYGIFFNVQYQIFESKIYDVGFDSGFVYSLLLILLIYFSFGFGYSYKVVSSSALIIYSPNKILLLLYIVFEYILLFATNHLIEVNNFGILGFQNTESNFKLAGIVVNIREIIIPALAYSFYALCNRNLFLNAANTFLIILFVYFETTLRLTKGVLFYALIIIFFLYFHKNKLSLRKIILLIISFTLYLSIYGILKNLRDVNIDSNHTFFENIKLFIERMTGYRDYSLIYLNLQSYFDFNLVPADVYTHDILGVGWESLHGQAPGIFGYAILGYSLFFAPFFIFFLFYIYSKIYFCIDKMSDIYFRNILFIIVTIEYIATFTDGNIKIINPSVTAVLRLSGIVIFIFLLKFLLKPFSNLKKDATT